MVTSCPSTHAGVHVRTYANIVPTHILSKLYTCFRAGPAHAFKEKRVPCTTGLSGLILDVYVNVRWMLLIVKFEKAFLIWFFGSWWSHILPISPFDLNLMYQHQRGPLSYPLVTFSKETKLSAYFLAFEQICIVECWGHCWASYSLQNSTRPVILPSHHHFKWPLKLSCAHTLRWLSLETSIHDGIHYFFHTLIRHTEQRKQLMPGEDCMSLCIYVSGPEYPKLRAQPGQHPPSIEPRTCQRKMCMPPWRAARCTSLENVRAL